jgi:hypothetical protein
MESNAMTIHIEVTDLFGGEANYSWVRRFDLPELTGKATTLALVRAVKLAIGWNGMHCKVDNFGDMIRIDATPSGLLNVCFITFE